MSEEQNDSPAFRLRPRRAAPKSYYTVRLEYSANPAAFIRERPRNSSKRKIFTQKTGSNTTKTASNQSPYNSPTVVSKEEREHEQRRLMLRRDISQSITTNTMISPFIQRLRLDELEPNSVYEHDYISLRIKKVETSYHGRLLVCFCHGTDTSTASSSPTPTPEYGVIVHLYRDYADATLVKPGKIISIAKFKTGPAISTEDGPEAMAACDRSSPDNLGLSSSGACASPLNNSSTSSGRSNQSSQSLSEPSDKTQQKSVKNVQSDHQTRQSSKSSSPVALGEHERPPESGSSNDLETIVLPFNVIVKYNELVERSTSNSNRGSSPNCTQVASPSLGSGASVSRRPMIPFVSITDMIEHPTEPFVEMSFQPPSPAAHNQRIEFEQQQTQQHNEQRSDLDDHENVEAKKVKFTANL